MKPLSQNLKYLRKKHGYTQAEMQAHTDISGATWSNYELGETEPDLETVIKIAKFFKVAVGDLIQGNFEGGNLIRQKRGAGNSEKGKLIGKGKGNLTGKKQLSEENLTVSRVEEFSEPYVARMPHVITVDSQGNENVIMVPVKARAGYLNGYGDPDFISTLPSYRLPGLNNGTFRMFEVDGHSMSDTLNDHDIIIGSFVDQWLTLRDDRVHVIVTKNEGVVVKRVLNRLKTDGKLILKSDNYKDRELYPTTVVDPQDVLEIWYGIAYISRQMRPPTEVYKRVVDLEGRFTLLEQSVKKLT